MLTSPQYCSKCVYPNVAVNLISMSEAVTYHAIEFLNKSNIYLISITCIEIKLSDVD